MARYQRKSLEENPERQIVLGMVVSDRFIKEVQPILRPDLLESPWAMKVIGWCQDYHTKFGKAPGVHIEDIFQQEVEQGNIDDDQESIISKLLGTLSDEYERSKEFNADFLLDRAEKYFETRNLEKKAANIKSHLGKGDLVAAQAEWNNYKPVSRPESMGVDPFSDRESMLSAFEHSSEPLFRLPGAVGKFLDDLMERESFVTLLGPEKRGKTWMLIEISLWARKAGRNVAFFSAGDMSQSQLEVRFGIRFAGRSNRPKNCGEILVPVLDCKRNQDDTCENPNRAGTFAIMDPNTKQLMSYDDCPDHQPCTYCLKNPGEQPGFLGSSWLKTRPPVEVLDGPGAAKAAQKLARRWGKKSRMKLIAFPNDTLTISRINQQLDAWEAQDSFIPDVIIIDYMDLIVPESNNSGEQVRHGIGKIWAGVRRMSQERHCLVISASQSDAGSYDVEWITNKNFSESKQKNAHVTGMITLNQTRIEKRRKIMRLGAILTREEAFDDHRGVTILQSLEQGKPLIASY